MQPPKIYQFKILHVKKTSKLVLGKEWVRILGDLKVKITLGTKPQSLDRGNTITGLWRTLHITSFLCYLLAKANIQIKERQILSHIIIDKNKNQRPIWSPTEMGRRRGLMYFSVPCRVYSRNFKCSSVWHLYISVCDHLKWTHSNALIKTLEEDNVQFLAMHDTLPKMSLLV